MTNIYNFEIEKTTTNHNIQSCSIKTNVDTFIELLFFCKKDKTQELDE